MAVGGDRCAQGQVLSAGLLDRTATVGERLRIDLYAAAVEGAATVVHILRGAHHQLAPGAEGAGIGDAAAGVHPGIGPRLHGTAILQAAIGGHDQFARLGAQVPGVANPDAMLRAQ
nr:hypothetical protein [Cupriavidus sp. SK-3]